MIYYKKGYKYQLTRDFTYQLSFTIPNAIEQEWFSITKSGLLKAKRGYAWDGPSGPTIDTKNFMRGSLEHDILYQCIRLELLSRSYKNLADLELKKICLEDGMCKLRAWWVFKALDGFADFAIMPSNESKELVAP